MSNQNRTILFFAGLGLSCLIYWQGIMDYFVVSKFMTLSVVLTIMTVLLVIDRKSKAAYKPVLVDYLLGGYYLWNLASCLWATHVPDALYESQKVLLLYLIYRYTRETLLRDKKAESLLPWAMVITAIVGLILVGVNYKEQLVDEGLKYSRDNLYLVQGFSGHKNLVASILMLFIPLVMMGFFRHRKTSGSLFLIVGIMLCAVACLWQTRSVWAAMVAGALAFGMGLPALRTVFNKPIVPTVAAMGLLTGATLFFGFINNPDFQGTTDLQAVADAGNRSEGERYQIWSKTGDLITQSPVLGVGNGNWRNEFPNVSVEGIHRLEIMVYSVNRPHNDYLWIWSELGIVGFGLFLAIIGLAFYGFFAVLANSQPNLMRSRSEVLDDEGRQKSDAVPEVSTTLILAIAGLTAYLVFAFLDFPRERLEFQIVLGLFLAIIVHHSWKFQPVGKEIKLPLKIWAAPVLGLLILNIYMGAQRQAGEKHSKLVDTYKNQNNWPLVLQESLEAEKDWFYQVEPGGTPVAWQAGVAQYNLGLAERAQGKNSNNQALINNGTQRIREAITHFERALAISPYRPEVINNLGSAHFELGDYETAAIHFNEALRINPKYRDALFNVAAIQINTDQLEAAAATLEQINPYGEQEIAQKKANFFQIIQNRRGSQ